MSKKLIFTKNGSLLLRDSGSVDTTGWNRDIGLDQTVVEFGSWITKYKWSLGEYNSEYNAIMAAGVFSIEPNIGDGMKFSR